MKKSRKLIIVGDSSFAEVAYEYFTHDSAYEVAAFSVEQAYLKRDQLYGLPVIPFEDLVKNCDPNQYEFFVAVAYTELNRLRTRLYLQAKHWGYRAASYISPRAFIWQNAKLGEHCFVFENNVVQPFVTIGDNVVLWSGNHVGHHSIVRDNCFIASHVVISGHCDIGKNCFVGVNCTISNQVKVAADCVLGAGTLILKDTMERAVYKGSAATQYKANSYDLFKITPDEFVC